MTAALTSDLTTDPATDLATGTTGQSVVAGVLPGATGLPAAAVATDHDAACANCGATLVGEWCHQCGQTAHLHHTLFSLVHDLFHGLFHFEGRIWRTLPMLAWHPGRLTRGYLAGQRMRYVSPVAAFLFATLLLFTVLQVGDQGRLKATASQPHNVELRIDNKDAAPWLKRSIMKMITEPELTAIRFEQNAHKYSWLLIVLSVPFVWLLFAFDRRYRLFDHCVFTTYSITFMMVLTAVLSLLGNVPGSGPFAGLAMVLVPPLHLYRQLREAYALSRPAAAWRATVLSLAAVTLLTVFVVGLLAIGLFGG